MRSRSQVIASHIGVIRDCRDAGRALYSRPSLPPEMKGQLPRPTLFDVRHRNLGTSKQCCRCFPLLPLTQLICRTHPHEAALGRLSPSSEKHWLHRYTRSPNLCGRLPNAWTLLRRLENRQKSQPGASQKTAPRNFPKLATVYRANAASRKFAGQVPGYPVQPQL